MNSTSAKTFVEPAGSSTAPNRQRALIVALNSKVDLAGTVISTRAKNLQEWRAERLAIDREQKLADQLAAQRRTEAYWEEERERQRLVALRLAEKQARERKIMIGLMVALALVILITAVLMILFGH